MPHHTTPQPQDSRCTDHRLGSNFALDGVLTGQIEKKKKDVRPLSNVNIRRAHRPDRAHHPAVHRPRRAGALINEINTNQSLDVNYSPSTSRSGSRSSGSTSDGGCGSTTHTLWVRTALAPRRASAHRRLDICVSSSDVAYVGEFVALARAPFVSRFSQRGCACPIRT